MKTKKFRRKLDLNKKTIANLNIPQMNRIRVGEEPIPTPGPESACGPTCETCETCVTCVSCDLSCDVTCTCYCPPPGTDIAASCIKCTGIRPC